MALEVLRLEGAVGDSDRSAQRVDVSRRKQPSGLFHPYTVTIRTRRGPAPGILCEQATAEAVVRQACSERSGNSR
jgi:hypothetical protein